MANNFGVERLCGRHFKRLNFLCDPSFGVKGARPIGKVSAEATLGAATRRRQTRGLSGTSLHGSGRFIFITLKKGRLSNGSRSPCPFDTWLNNEGPEACDTW